MIIATPAQKVRVEIANMAEPKELLATPNAKIPNIFLEAFGEGFLEDKHS